MKTLILNKDIYSIMGIQKAKAAYADFAKIHVLPQKHSWLLVFHSFRYDPEQTIQEFENYLIGLENT